MSQINSIIIFLILILNISKKQLLFYCDGLPLPSSPAILPQSSSSSSTIEVKFNKKDSSDQKYIVNLTRQHDGDIFSANAMSNCNSDTCVGLSSGTAGLSTTDDDVKKTKKNIKNEAEIDNCECRCLPYASTYREDLGICVDDIRECSLSPFFSGSSSEKIPFVFLPLRGQIIYPSREISFPDIQVPICAVTGSQYLSVNGWTDLRNPIDSDFPFRMFRDEGRTFLQWLGEPDLRHKMQGRLILIHLMCRDMAFSLNNKTTQPDLTKNIFTPCVSFRVNGSPVKYTHNVSEVLFQSESTSTLSASSDGLSAKEYIVIGICSLLLGLIYVASVFLYLHVKKRKSLSSESQNTLDDLDIDINYPKNDQVTFGAPFSRSGSSYSASRSINDPRNSQRSSTHGSNGGSLKEEMGVIKSNPLLKHFPNLSDHSGFTSDLSNSNSECEDSHSCKNDRNKNNQTSVIIHPMSVGKADLDRNIQLESPSSPTQENERLPEENVTITEDMAQDEKLENMRALVSGTVRKKLYFNPAYFEPHLLMSPPAAAIEFLTKIREVIAIAKYKMATKRYQPSLNMIPEELQNCSELNSRKSNKNQDPSEASQLKCGNCGDKRNSIQKWLETVPVHQIIKQEIKSDKAIEVRDSKQERKQVSPPKSKPPPIPVNAPKIVSHSLKPHIQQNIEEEPTNLAQTVQLKENPISVKRQLENIYSFAETGSEIYNNPKFNHLESPQLSQKSQKSRSSHHSKSRRKKIEVLDQYAATPQRDPYEMLKSMKPDLVYEALAKDFSMKMHSAHNFTNCDNSKINNMNSFSIPTPDYDSTFDKNVKDIYNNTQSSAPSVPTPDYSTLGKKPLRQYQPDSPIYRRKSPQYLIVDYETDSLERTSTSHRKNIPATSSSSPSSNNSSDLSSPSQPSPSLSTALPLEEEVEIRHTIYDKVEGFRQDGDTNLKKKLTKEYEDVNVKAPRIKYDTPFRGSMTIEVEHEPLSDIELSTDSDQFEPDTLDRKLKKHSFCDVEAWSEHLNKSKNFVNSIDDKVSYSSLENMQSLPELNESNKSHYVLRSSNSFRNNTETNCDEEKNEAKYTKLESKPSFGSLREIYQSKTHNQRPKLTSIDFTDKGRLLTLEAKHTRRQRNKLEDETIKKIMPPDVIPSAKKNQIHSTTTNYYDVPKVQNLRTKNYNGWNTDDFNGNNLQDQIIDITDVAYHNQCDDDDAMEVNSTHSESTEITGVSDTIKENSETEHSSSITMKTKKFDDLCAIENNVRINKSKSLDLRNDYSLNKYLMRKQSNVSEYSKIDRGTAKLSSLLCPIESKPINIQTVYRVEINQNTSGMQIALSLKDRSKKSKDLKNAWKKFVSLATSKFHQKMDNKECDLDLGEEDKKTTLNTFEIDEGISSLTEENPQATTSDCNNGFKHPRLKYYENRFGHHKQDLDSGYISADSSEVYNRRFYDRYNFKMMSDNIDAVSEDCVNEVVENVETSKIGKTEININKENKGEHRNDIVCFEPFEINIYSSDEDRFSVRSSDENGEENLSESGAESVETHSVLFKSIRKTNNELN